MAKKCNVIAVLIILWYLPAFSQENTTIYKYRARQIPLQQIIHDLENITGLYFAYSPERIPLTKKITCNVATNQLTTLLDEVLKKNGIQWENLNGQIVLTGTIEPIKERKIVVSGIITDSTSGVYIPGAILTTESGKELAYSNSYGYFSLQIPIETKRLLVSGVGYKTQLLQINPFSTELLQIKLHPLVIEMGIIEVKAPLKEENKIGNEVNINPSIWGMGGHNDIIQVLNSVPGFHLFGDGSTRFFVRGGESNQNMILIDETPIYNPSHLFGFFNALAPEAISEVKAWKGDAPARYGGGLASIIDVHVREGNMYKNIISGNLGPYASSLTIEGPILKEKMSFLISGRRSNMEWLKPSNYTPASFNFYFFDLNLKLNTILNTRNRLYFTFYSGEDNISQLTESSVKTYGMKWNNLTGNIRWNYIPTHKIFLNTTLARSKYNYFLFLDSRHDSYWRSSIEGMHLKSDLTWFLNSDNTLRAGISLENLIADPGNIHQSEIDSSNYTKSFPSYRSLSCQPYFEHQTALLDKKLVINYGFRIPIWSDYGPFYLHYYNPDYEPFYTDTIEKNQIYYTHLGFEPRIHISFHLRPQWKLMLNYSRTLQFFQSLSNSISPFSTIENWVPAGPNISPQIADLFSLGSENHFLQNTYSLFIEAYLKLAHNQIDYEEHANLLYNAYQEGELRFGKAKAYGIEIWLKKNSGKLLGWLGYTYSRVSRETKDINNNQSYYPYYDRPHQLQIRLAYHLSPRFNFNAAWYYMTGGRTTVPSAFYDYNNLIIPIYNEKNNMRLPDYHRLDIAAEFRLSRQGSRFRQILSLSIYNIYNRNNPFLVSFNKIMDDNGNFVVPANFDQKQTIIPTQLSVAGIIPSINYKFSF